MQQLSMQSSQNYDKLAPIVDQWDAVDGIAMALLSVWIRVRIEILQMSPSLVPTSSDEELGLVRRLIRQYGKLSPSEFAECIRLAAIQKQKDLSQRLVTFPTLYAADFEEELQKMSLQKLKNDENALQLPANTGGNIFFGEPSEAIAREWPRIMAHTEMIRKTINPNLRDRFWYGGSKDQRASATAMLGQMVTDLRAAGVWEQRPFEWAAVRVFQAEYRLNFVGPEWERFIEGMEAPMTKAQVDEIRAKVERRIGNASAVGAAVPSIDLFPDPKDCTFCAIFDEYWKHWETVKTMKGAEIL